MIVFWFAFYSVLYIGDCNLYPTPCFSRIFLCGEENLIESQIASSPVGAGWPDQGQSDSLRCHTLIDNFLIIIIIIFYWYHITFSLTRERVAPPGFTPLATSLSYIRTLMPPSYLSIGLLHLLNIVVKRVKNSTEKKITWRNNTEAIVRNLPL